MTSSGDDRERLGSRSAPTLMGEQSTSKVDEEAAITGK
jgi:hypothetical protein